MSGRTGRGTRRTAALVALLAVVASSLLVGAGGAAAQETVDPTVPESATVTTNQPPAAPVVETSVVDVRTVTWTWQEGGATSSCVLDGPGGTSVPACSGGSLTETLPRTNGSWTLTVVLEDAGGRSEPGSSAPFVLDEPTPPAPQVTPDRTSGTSTGVTWTWDAGGADSSCTLVAPAGSRTDLGACASPLATDVTAVEGDHVLEVTLRTGSPTAATGTSSPYALDLPAPPAPVFEQQPAGGSSRTVTWTWSQPEGTATCTLLGPGAGDRTVVSCPVPGTATVVLPEANGDHRLEVVVDGAGGSSSAVSAPYALLLPPPAGPAVTVTGTGTDVTWSWDQAADEGGTCTVTGPAGWSVVEACRGTLSPALPRVEGEYLLQVVLTSPRGTSEPGTSAFVLDLPAPAVPEVTGPSGSGSVPDVVYAWSQAADETAACTLLGDAGATPVPCANGATTTLPADGAWRLEVVLTGPGGTATGTSPLHVLDTVAPSAPVFTTRPPAAGSGTSPTWSLTADAPTTCAVPGLTEPVPCSGTYTAPLAGQPDGAYSVQVVARDEAGNTATTTGTYVLDRVAPAAPVLVAQQPERGSGTAPSWTVSADEPVTCALTDAEGTALQTVEGCAGLYVMPLQLRPDGTYTLTATATDAAGNTGPAATATYTLDTTGPALTVTGPTGDGNDPAPGWAWSAGETVSSATCALLRTTGTGAEVVASASCLDGTYRPDLPGDGAYAVRVEVADAVGNATEATSGTYRLDATAPDLPVVSGPEGPSADPTVTWSWTGEGTPTCRLARDGATADLPCTGSGVSTTLPGSGTWVLEVELRDAVGNTSATGRSAPYVLDVTAPDAPGVEVSATGHDRTPAWTIAAEPGAALACRLTAPAGTVPAWAPCTSPHAPVLDGPDGRWLLEVRATDALGNEGPVGSATHLLDTEAPAAPALTGPVGLGNDPRPVWAWTEVPGTTAQCRLLPGGDLQPCAGGTFAPALPGDGTWAAAVELTDAAGNTGAPGTSASYVYDGTPPAPAVLSGPTGTGSTASVSWSVTGEGTARCRLLLGTSPGGWSDCTAGFTAVLDVDGSWALEAELTDAAGNTSTALSPPYLLDRVPPGVPGVDGPRGPSREALVTWSVSTEPGTTVECRLTGPEPTDWSACAPTVTRGLALDGEHVLEARLVDAALNVGGVGTSPAYLLDRTAPQAPAVGGPSGPSTDRAPSWSFVLGDAASAECALRRDGAVVQDWQRCASPAGRDLTGAADGGYALAVRLTDAAGNTGPAGSSQTYVLDTTAPAAPVVTAPPGPSRVTSPLVAFTGEPGARASCRAVRAGTTAGPFDACTSPWSAPLSGDGTWTAEVRLTDAAGNTGDAGTSAGWVLDTAAPATPEVSAPRSPGRDTEPTWSVVAEDGAALTCRTTSPAGSVSAWTPCTFPHTTDLRSGPDGTWTLEVRATDEAGGTSGTGRAVYLLDTAAPVAPALTAPRTPSRDRAPSFGVVAGPGETTACRLTRGAVALQDWARCSTPVVLDLTGLADGAYTLAVRATDEAGSTGPVATATHVLDTTAPVPPTLTDLPASPNPSRRPRFSFTAETDATTTCRVRSADDLLVRDETCTSPWTPDLTDVPDGAYRVAVRATDAAGNVSEPAVTSYVLDGTAPDAAVVTAPRSPGTTRAPVWTVLAHAPAECRLSRGSTVLVDWRTCADSYRADLSTAPDGTYVLSVRLRDTAGNLSAVTTSRYVLDTQGAAPATLTSPPSPSSTRTPTWVVGTKEEAVTAECRVLAGTTVRVDWAPCAVSAAGQPFALDLAGEPDGAWTLVVRLVDAAGNTGGEQRSTYVLDTTPPGAVSVAEPGSPNPDTTPTWLLVAGPGETLACRLTTAGQVLRDWSACTSPYTVDLSGRPDATYTLTVRAVDAAGNIGPDRTSAYRLDASAPLAPGAVVGPTGPSTDRRPTWTFVLEPGSTATCMVTRGRTTLRSGACRSPYALDLSGQPDGSYTVTVRAVDAAGNAGPASAVGYVLDTTPPDAPAFTLEPGSPSATTAPRWGWSTPAGATSQCRTSARTAAPPEWATCTSPWTAALSEAPDGTYGLQVRAVDAAGNASPVLAGEYRLDRTAGLLAGYASVPPAVGSDRTPTWGLQAEQGQALQCRLVGPDAASSWAACGTATPAGGTATPAGGTRGALALVGAGSHTVSLAGRPDGAYVLELRGVGADGTPGPASRSTYRLDTTRPAPVTLTSGPTGDDAGTDAAAAWSWEADPSAVVECRLLRDGSPTGGSAPCSSPYLVDLRERGEAAYVLELRAVDAAGNTGDVVRGSYRYDTTPPPPAVFTGRPVPATGARSVTWTFSQPDDTSASCTVSRDGQALAEQACARGYVFVVGDRGAGTYVLSVVLRDAAGNAGEPARSSWTLTGGAPPPRAGTPDEGTTDGGQDPGRPALVLPVGPDSAPSALPRQGPPLPGGPGTPVAVGPQLQEVALQRSVATTVADGPGALDQVGRAVDRLREALPDTITLPRPAEVPEAIGRVFGETFRNAARQPTLPLTVLLVVVLFLLVQNRIDRRDPKLASAPVEAEPELVFGPVHRAHGVDPGGATA